MKTPYEHEAIILGELREFKRATLERLAVIERKTDSFQAFHAKIIGFAAFSSLLATSVVEWLRSKW